MIDITLQKPTKVNHHDRTKLPGILLLNDFNALVEMFVSGVAVVSKDINIKIYELRFLLAYSSTNFKTFWLAKVLWYFVALRFSKKF